MATTQPENNVPQEPAKRRKVDSSSGSPGGTSVAPPHAVNVAPPPPSLHLLNQASSKRGSWDVAIADARIESYSYEWEGQPRTTTAFRCSLVSLSDPTAYCMGELKKEGQAKMTPATAQTKYKNGSSYNPFRSNIEIKMTPNWKQQIPQQLQQLNQ